MAEPFEPEVTVKVPAALVKLVERLAARARSGVWGEISFGLKGGKPSGTLKWTESEPLDK